QAQHVIGAVRTLYSVEPAGRGGNQLVKTCHGLVLREEGLVLSQLEHAGGLSAPAKRVSLSQLDLCKLGEIDSLRICPPSSSSATACAACAATMNCRRPTWRRGWRSARAISLILRATSGR